MYYIFSIPSENELLGVLAGGESRAGLGADVHQIFAGFKTGQRLAAR